MFADILYTIIIISIIFIIYLMVTHYNEQMDCPEVLVQKGKFIYLLNKNNKMILKFNNLDEYHDYHKKQLLNGKKCPELYLQKSYSVQNEPVYINRKSPFEKEGGTPLISGLDLQTENNYSLLIDSTRNNPPFNNNLFPGFDPMNQYVGLETPLDKMYATNSNVHPIVSTTKYEGEYFNQTNP